MTFRATATSTVGEVPEMPKIGVLIPLTRDNFGELHDTDYSTKTDP